MTLSSKIFFGLMAALCSLFLVCSRSDVITGVGGDVVKDMDGTLTDMAGGFARIDLGPADVVAAYSLPSAPDPAFSTQASSFIYAGVSDHGDTLAAHMQFQVTPFPSGTPRYLHEDTPVSAFLYFVADDALGASDSIAVFPSDTLTGLRPVNRSDKKESMVINNRGDEDDDDGGGVAGGGVTTNRFGAFAFGGAASSVDSIPLPLNAGSIADSIFKVRTDTSAAPYAFAFSIVDYTGKMRRIRNPYVIIRVTKAFGGDTVSDTVHSFTRYTAYENAAVERAGLPFSSQLTQRTAVFKVNIGKIIDSLGGGPHELINAALSITWKNIGIEASADAPDSIASGNYKAVVLDTLLTNELPPDSLTNMGLRNQFSLVGSNAPMRPYNVHQIKTPLRSALDKAGGAERYIYVYLRATADLGAITWETPKKVETVFTPSRSQ